MALRRHDLCGPRPPPKASHLKPGVHRNREERLFRVLLAPFERVELRSTRVHAARGGSDARPSARRRYARPEEAIDFGRHCLTSDDKRRTRRVVDLGVAASASCEERDYKGLHALPSNITRDGPPITRDYPPLPSNITREVTHGMASEGNPGSIWMV